MAADATAMAFPHLDRLIASRVGLDDSAVPLSSVPGRKPGLEDAKALAQARRHPPGPVRQAAASEPDREGRSVEGLAAGMAQVALTFLLKLFGLVRVRTVLDELRNRRPAARC